MRIVPEPVELKNGLTGTEQLVFYIQRLIDEGARRPEVRQLARDVVKLARPQDATAEIQAVWDYLTTSITAPPYRMDPVDLQLLTWPEAIESLSAYDCKKITIVAGALLQALGHPVKVRVIDQRPQDPQRGADYHHVYLQVFNKDTGKTVSFDPVAKNWRHPGASVGSELAHQARRTYMPIRPATQIRDGYAVRQSGGVGFSLYNDLLKYVDPTREENKNLRSIATAIPYVSTVVAVADVAAAANKAAAAKAPAKPAPAAIVKAPAPPAPAKPPPAASAPAALTMAAKPGLSTGAKIGIAVGGAAVVGLVAFALTRKGKRRSNPRRRRRSRAA